MGASVGYAPLVGAGIGAEEGGSVGAVFPSEAGDETACGSADELHSQPMT